MNNKSKKQKKEIYLVDTSAIIHKKVSKLIKQNKIKGTILIPNAAIAELEHLANKGQDVGFKGLEEIAKFHRYKNIKVKFVGPRPSESHIKYAKSGEIDALIRSLASTYKATLITSDIVQSKSAAAYGIKTLFHRVRPKKLKKKFFFWKRK
ncbi:MAG: PIN domain-containing protein [Candidatus Pacearchaeota archaeon]